MKIADREIGHGPPYLVAEISGNHGGELKKAIELIKAAKKVGADAVKTQCYEPDTITLDCKKLDFIAQGGLWRGRTLYELYGKAHTPFAWHKDLFKVAQDEKITIFSSVFDFSSIDLLERLDCPAYKIASFEVNDIPLIRYAAGTGKPVIISTGMATEAEITEADIASDQEACFLHCTSEYPGTVENSDLRRMGRLAVLINRPLVGLSDHTSWGTEAPVAATVLGASMIEKHLCLKGFETEDSQFSLTPDQFGMMVYSVHVTYEGLMPRPSQTANRQFRRSLYAVKDIKEGEVFTEDNIRSIRPGYGLPPKMYPTLLGRRAQKNFRRGDPLS